ncbi:MAG: aminoacyl-histidine dipeptidase [Schleiferiaceae bacterium]|nr:aminoacyl-histidine dipeptidase [Schleiferiaceae bacterium]
MNQDILNLEPRAVWEAFHQLNQVPRPSKREDQIQAWAMSFGKSLNLPTDMDHVGNVRIIKGGTAGLESSATLVLQAHLDMVCQQNEGNNHDFDKDPIDMYIANGWVKARGTTLGSDNGIGVAMSMALLRSKAIAHPPLEVLFTSDEETGMTGALGLKEGWITGKYLLNIDTEDDRELTIGCAGGVDVTCTRSIKKVTLEGDYTWQTLTLKGLTGGHSGMDIHLGLGNANTLLTRALLALQQTDMRLVSMHGGNLRNVIPRSCEATFAVPTANLDAMKEALSMAQKEINQEYRRTDPDMQWLMRDAEAEEVMQPSEQADVLKAIHGIPVGILRMSPEIEGLVQTSNNLSALKIAGDQAQILCLTRSASETEKVHAADRIASVAQLGGFSTELAGDYPGWEPAGDSNLTEMMKSIYVKSFNREPEVSACHAGLECGIIGESCPGMKMISFGPNIRGAHSPDERVEIVSVQKVWDFFLDVIAAAPEALD